MQDGICVDAKRAGMLAGVTLPGDALALIAGDRAAVAAASAAASAVAKLSPEEAGERGLALELESLKLRPPIPRPGKMICIGRNFRAHAEEAGLELVDYPIMFPKFGTTLIGSGESIVRPRVSHELDWEGELAVVIGAPCRHSSYEDAMSAVFGYTLFNDVTLRDYQFRSSQYVAGKNFDTSGPLGPWLVVADELPDPHTVELRTTVNGELKQEGNTRDFIFDIPRIIEIVSEWITLEPGDVIAMGTPAGVGFKRTPPEFLKPGDVVAVSGSGPLGTLENPVVDEVES
jgi:2-keto-4-pentenoate hydratase/2-oxohepta-3-ene-1,7-dioic acid hydratase in catechol pathway